MLPKIAIVYLAYHPEPFWKNAEQGIAESSYPKNLIDLIIVDNPHEEFGSAQKFFRDEVLFKSGLSLPKITMLPQTKNLGFAGGMNVGISHALELGAEYIFLHNQDGYLSVTSLEELVKSMQSDPKIGAAQALIRLTPETNLINSAGNLYNFLGFGFAGSYRRKFEPLNFNRTVDVGYASGAALMLNAKILKQVKLFEESFQSYHEDLELGLRLRFAGFRNVLVGTAYFFHAYEFNRNATKYYLMERNRFAVLFMYYRLFTLIIILPVLVATEFMVYVQASLNGWLGSKVTATKYWLNFEHLAQLYKLRRARQKLRTITDRELIKSSVGYLDLTLTGSDNYFATYLGNPLLGLYFWLVKNLIFW